MRFIQLAGVAALALLSVEASAAADSAAKIAAVTADPVIAAERAFAARHQEVSVKEAFQEFSAADGVALTPEGVRNVKEFLGTWPDTPNPGFIAWWPTMAGIAQSGDLGFTTGPASYNKGQQFSEYFTVWKKQADGSWKWLMDLGTRPRKAAGATSQDVFVVPPSGVGAIDPKTAWAALDADEAKLTALAATDAAVAAYYAADVRVMGYKALPANGIDAARAMLAERAADLKTQRQGSGVSDAGDLGYTYGVATWTQGDRAVTGPYLRVWQRRADGWKVLVENVSPF